MFFKARMVSIIYKSIKSVQGTKSDLMIIKDFLANGLLRYEEVVDLFGCYNSLNLEIRRNQ